MNMRFANAFEGRAAGAREAVQGMSRRTRLIAGAALIAAALATLWYLSNGQGAETRERPPPRVVVAAATSRNVTVVEHAMGTVVANATVQVTAQVTGRMLRADFQEGQIVRTGDLLFEIDPRPFQAALDQARADLAKDTAQLVKARNDKTRYDALFAQNAVSSQQRDLADATAKSAAATVEADRAAVEMAQLNLGYTQIRSPVNGKTGAILVQPGNLVTANGTNPLVVVTQIEPVKVSFALPQSDLPRIQARDRAGKLLALLDTHEADAARLSAPVNFVGNQVSGQTGTIELRATFDNRDHRLVPGQLVDVDVTLDEIKNATVVPREAVNDGPNGRYVYVVSRDGVAKMRTVRVLFEDGADMAVDGVRRGDRVITDGQLRVMPNKKVVVVKPQRAGKSPGPR